MDKNPMIRSSSLWADIAAKISAHASKPLLGVAAVCAVLTVAEWIMVPAVTTYMAVLSALHIALIMAVPWVSRWSSALLVVLYACSAILPDPTGPSQFWGVWFALFCLAYEQNSLYSLAWPVFASLTRVAQTVAAHETMMNSLLVIMIFFVSWLIGYALRQRRESMEKAAQRHRYEQMQQQLALMRRDMALASKIHDSVTSNLAYLAIMLERAKQEVSTDGRESFDFTVLHNKTIETLNEVRQVIDVLASDSLPVENTNQPPLQATIGSELADGDQYLHTLGFLGESRLNIDSPVEDMQYEVIEEVSDLLRELYTNIAVHGCASPHEYSLDVRIGNKEVTVSQINDIASQSSFPDKPTSGKGLNFHRYILRGWGGQLDTCAEDDTWVCHANIPRCRNTMQRRRTK